MEFEQVVRRRMMVRSFQSRPVPPEVVERILENAQHAPSAGFSQGWAFVVLEGAETEVFWRHAAGPEWRAGPNWPHLMDAPLIIIPLAAKQVYLDRYAEPDKQSSGLMAEDRWPAPYWDIDTGMATLLMLLTAVDAGLGALFFRIERGEDGLLADLGVPAAYRPIGAVAIGYPDGRDRPSPSLVRGRRPASQVIHRGRWQAGPH
jgi:nitroreductase